MPKKGDTGKGTLPDGWPRILAHRGASSLAPENTIAAFSLARKLGAKGVEFDVHLARTGEAVVTHDHRLDRVAALPLRVEDCSLADLREIDVGSFFGQSQGDSVGPPFRGERIPTLDEVLETVGADCFCDIELKATARNARALAETVAGTLARHGRTNCIVSSFNPFAILAFARASDIPTAAIYCPYPSVPFFLRHRECLYLSGADVKKPARETALSSPRFETGSRPVIVWTVDSLEEALRLFSGGVRSIITNRIQDFARMD